MPILLCVLMAWGCGGTDDTISGANNSTADAGAADVGQPQPDLTDEVYDPTQLLKVEIELAAGDWDTLRKQTRTWTGLFGGDCLKGPFASPFTWFKGTVKVNGQTFEEADVRKKGFLGSMDDMRPSLKVDLGEHIDGQQFKGVRHLTLNNSKQDPSLARTCLAYSLFKSAGIAAPRCSHAVVSVNGQSLGVYVLLEPLKKDFLKRHFADSKGALLEGALSDFTNRLNVTFDPKNSAAEGVSVDPVMKALESPDDQLEATLGEVLDVDAFINFWAAEVLVGHTDGYTANRNNFYLFQDQQKWKFLPWGADNVLRPATELQQTALPVFWSSVLAYRLYGIKSTRDRYEDRLYALVTQVWNTDALVKEVDRVQALVEPALSSLQDSAKFKGDIDDLRKHLKERPEALKQWLNNGLPPRGEAVPEPECMLTKGKVTVTFSTTWGSLQSAPEKWFDGKTQMTAFYQGETLPIFAAASPAGPGDDGPGILLFGTMGEDEHIIVWLPVDPASLTTDAPMSVEGFAIYTNKSKGINDAFLGSVPGKLTLSSADTKADGGIVGSFSGDIIWFEDKADKDD